MTTGPTDNADAVLLRDLGRAGGARGIAEDTGPQPLVAEDWAELRDKRTDLLDIRGILSPNGGERVVPFELGDTVGPAVRWLVDWCTALTVAARAAVSLLGMSDCTDGDCPGAGEPTTEATCTECAALNLLANALKTGDRTRTDEEENT